MKRILSESFGTCSGSAFLQVRGGDAGQGCGAVRDNAPNAQITMIG